MFKKMFKLSRSEKGEVYIGDSVKIIIAVVIGAALLAGLIGIANKVILPATQSWLESMFTSTDKYVGSIEEDALEIDSKESIIAILGISESEFYNKYKDDPDLDDEVCTIYTIILYGGNPYGIEVDREEVRRSLEEQIARDPDSITPKEMEFYQDWVNEFDTASSIINDPRFDTCSNEIVHYVAEYSKDEITEEEMRDRIVASAEKHGFDSEAVLSNLFG